MTRDNLPSKCQPPSEIRILTWIVLLDMRYLPWWELIADIHQVCFVTQLRVILCGPVDCSPPGSFVHGISQWGILEQVSISSSRGSSWPRDWTQVSCSFYISRWILYHQHHLGSPSSRVMGTIIGAVVCSVNILRRRDADGPTSILAALKPVWLQGIYLPEPLRPC